MKELETRDEFFYEADPALIEKFENSWLQNDPLEISECLPRENEPTYKGTLEELTHIDREFRWKNRKPESSESLRPLESYFENYPALYDFKIGLIQGEFELAHRFSDNVSIEQFVERFGERVDGQELRPLLERRLKQWKTVQPVRPGSTLGRYEIVNEQGRGGFGAVWRAKDTQLGRRIAVKQLGQRLANDAESRRRFISEARVTARLQHPGIVPVYDISNVDEDHAYYTMRLIQGQTLAEAIDELFEFDPATDDFRLGRRKLLQSFIDVCRTIEYAHAQGVNHRDIKPQNIIVGDYGETILLDWGLASVTTEAESKPESESLASDPEILSAVESMKTLEGGVVGTPAYMPPEQAKGELESIGFPSDVYSLGATLYHLVSGQIPFSTESKLNILDRVKTGDLEPVDKILPSVEKPLASIVSHAMDLESDNRYGSVGDMADDVQRFLADQPITAYRDPVWARVSRTIRKHPTAAAMLGLCTLFIVAAVATSWILINAWQTRESNRISSLQIGAEKANATAASQIINGRFDEALKSLQQARELIQGEQALANLDAMLASKESRIGRILEFYRLGSKAQEATFLDRPDDSAMFCQAAVNQLKILDNPDWWRELPVEDLTWEQRDELQIEVYRILTLLASMRLAEISDGATTMGMLFEPKTLPADSPGAYSLRAARFAASAANRYRPSRAMQLIVDLADYSLGQSTDTTFLKDLNPKNATDSAVMGSILDNNMPDEKLRQQASFLLGQRDPHLVARQWLNDGMQEYPDWYWLPLFIGNSQMRTMHYEDAIRTLSHALGVRPDFAIGYQYRAMANVRASIVETSRLRRRELLNSASRDIQRALDLQPDFSELYWSLALIQTHMKSDAEAIADSFLTGFSLHPDLGVTHGNHFSAISKLFFNEAQKFVDIQKGNDNLTAKISLLEIAIATWKLEFENAEDLCRKALELFPDNEPLKSMQRFVRNQSPNNDQRYIEFISTSPFSWHYQFSNALQLEKKGDFEEAVYVLETALELARPEWQKSKTRLALVRCLALNEERSSAVEWIKKSYELDQSSNFGPLQDLAKQKGWKDIMRACDEMIQLTESRQNYVETADTIIRHPALLNGNFELGLSFHWAQFTRRKTASVWNNFGKSNSVAMVSQDDPFEGNQCLTLKLNSPMEVESFGWMSQSFPVSVGKKYRVKFQYKTDRIQLSGLQVGLMGDKEGEFAERVLLDPGTRIWTELSFEFTAEKPVETIAFKGLGTGQVWLDSFTVGIVN